MFDLKVFLLVLLYLQNGSTIDSSSPCGVPSSKVGPLKSSNVIYTVMYFERINLATMTSVVTQSQATLSSCAVLCSNRVISSSESCNIYYVEAGKCTAGVMDNPQQYALLPGSSPTLVAVNVNVATKGQNLGTLVHPVDGTSSSTYGANQYVVKLWDGIYGYMENFMTASTNPYEYVQLDFGTCDLTFVQFIIFGEPTSANPPTTLGYPLRSANVEIRVGNKQLTDVGQTRSSNPLCAQLVGTPPATPVYQIFKCRKQLMGRFVTIQHFNRAEQISICEVLTYAF